MENTINTRSIILDILIEINEKGMYSNIILRNALAKYRYLQHSDRAFISRVVKGTVERKITLDYCINSLSKVKINKMKPVIRNILRMSAYQIIFMDSVTDYAVCNEAVKLARSRKFVNLGGFVNGVLRNLCREKDDLLDENKMTDSIRYSTPEWLVDYWKEAYGEDKAKELLKSQYTKRCLSIRCNTTKCSPKELADLLEKQGIKVTVPGYPAEALLIEDYDYIEKLDEFNKGYFTIQDISSMLVGSILNPPENALVMDVCAAPGSKTTHVAELLKGRGRVISRDLTEQKVALIEENLERLDLKNVKTECFDARITDEEYIGIADAVIADLPCSGLGIIGRKPDIKYNMNRENMDSLAELQREILRAVSAYVKPGGKLIYSTCTLNPRENKDNAEWIARTLPFEAADLQIEGAVGNTFEIFPDDTHDGFFISAFVRKE